MKQENYCINCKHVQILEHQSFWCWCGSTMYMDYLRGEAHLTNGKFCRTMREDKALCPHYARKWWKFWAAK
jgi:hypothetical protein